MWIDQRLNEYNTNDVYEGEVLTMDQETMVMLQIDRERGEDYFFRPPVLGGSLEFYVEMGTMDPGCIAGVYLVPVNDYCGVTSAISAYNPRCPSITVMQANNWGF